MERLDQGREYWLICKRFNAWIRTNPGIRAVAIGDMIKLRERTTSDAVIRRINSFIARNQVQSPGNNGGNGGPRVA